MRKISGLLLLISLVVSHSSLSQKMDTTTQIFRFGGAALVTNNGISLIPTFSLGKPAAIFNLIMGGQKFSFEPEFRFSLEAKPWTFLFWWRYKLLQRDKFRMNIGAHPALNFRTIRTEVNGSAKETIVTRRYLAGELSPNYFVAKNISIGIYYLYSHGIDKEAVRNTHFLTVNTNFAHIGLGSKLVARFTPQLYYLVQDGKGGYYFTSGLTLAMKHFPLSIQSIINKTIRTDVPGSQNFVWNVSLMYTFSKQYVQR